LDRDMARKIKQDVNTKFVENQLKLSKTYGVNIISFWDAEYPIRLKEIYDPPALLFVKGSISKVNDKCVAIVGTRSPSSYGKLVTEQICSGLVNSGYTIISGLARGVDTIAHQTAVKLNGRTIAVIGSGFDYMYPPENKRLAEMIAESGAIISEFPFQTIPDPANFPRRNRIISGLSLGILISEAGSKSGALITAYHALEQNREVFAIPGQITSVRSSGTNRMIQEGAKLVTDISDILQELEGQLGQHYTEQKQSPQNLSPAELKVYQLLDEQPIHIDQVLQKCDLSSAQVLSALLTLELSGAVRQLSGKMFIRV